LPWEEKKVKENVITHRKKGLGFFERCGEARGGERTLLKYFQEGKGDGVSNFDMTAVQKEEEAEETTVT